MGEIDYIFSTDSSEDFTSCLVKNGPAAIMMRLEPFPLKDSPDSLSYVEMWAIWRQEKEIETSLFPYISHLGNHSFSMNGGVVEYNKCRLDNLLGKIIKIICQQLSSNGFGSVKSVIYAVWRHHSEDVEPLFLLSRNKNIFIIKLPTIRHVSGSAYMTLVSESEVNKSFFPEFYKFLQLKRFKIYQLRRGNSPWTYSYTFISCANNSKKRLNVVSLTFRLESSSHFALAVFMLSRCSRTASFTASVSVELIKGFAPRPPFSLSPSNPSDWYCLNHLYIASLPYPTNSCISCILLLSAFINMALQRIRNRWHEPKRYALSRADFCSSLNTIFFVFPIVCFPFRINTLRDKQKSCHIVYF